MVLSGSILLILSLISPAIVSFLTKSTMSSKTKQLIAMAISLAIGAIVAFTTGGASLVVDLGWNGFLESLLVAAPIAYAAQQAVYTFLFKGTEFSDHLFYETGVGRGEYPETDADGSGFAAEDDYEFENTDNGLPESDVQPFLGR